MYLAFGHDEEVGGDLGAGAIARLLASRGVTLDFVVDEGGPILLDGLPSLLRTPIQIALVGTAEKVRRFTRSHKNAKAGIRICCENLRTMHAQSKWL